MKKKYLLFAIIIGFCLFGCKKDSPTLELIQVNVSIPILTTYSLGIKNANNDVGITNVMTNAVFTLNAYSGDQIPVVYEFQTQGQSTGQGTITFTYNGNTLLTINGGSGTQTLSIP
jgi:hypothetical protein